MAKIIHKGVELPFEVPIDALDIPEEYFAILPPLPRGAKRLYRLTVDSETGELVWDFNPYNDY